MDRRRVGILVIAAAGLVAAHHVLVAGRLFDLADILHHEFFYASLAAFGLGVLWALERQRRRTA